MKQFAVILIIVVLFACKKKEEDKTSEPKTVTYKASCDSCYLTYWEYTNGNGLAIDSTVQGNFEHSFVSDVPRQLMFSIKYDKSDKPVSLYIYVNNNMVGTMTDTAIRYGQSDVGKSWPYLSYYLE